MFICFIICAIGCVLVDSRVTEELENELVNPFERALYKHRIEYVTGYVTVRPGADLFWLLYYADGQRAGADRKPMILWIQGGPGLAASGIGNFLEIGPLDLDFNYRNHTWIRGNNLLLIDSPVGTGFSAMTSETVPATKDKTVVADLVQTLKGFLKVHPEFRLTPWHIFSQSYGGKLAPKLAYRLQVAKRKGLIDMDLRSVGIGSGFVDPGETISSASDYMFNMGLIDLSEYRTIKMQSDSILQMIQKNDYMQAFSIFLHQYDEIDAAVYSINKNNVLLPPIWAKFDKLEQIIMKYVQPVFKNIRPVDKWPYLARTVYIQLSGNMFLPSNKYVEKLLNETNIRVIVYNGNLDAVTPLAGCVRWVHNLRWEGAEQFAAQKRIKIDGENNGFYKEYGSLSLWSVFKAGHWVPTENPEAMHQILEYAKH